MKKTLVCAIPFILLSISSSADMNIRRQGLSTQNTKAIENLRIQTPDGEFLRVDDQWIDTAYFESGFLENAKGQLIMGGKPKKVTPWPDGILPIRFRKDVDKKVRDLIWAACKEWSTAANVKCIAGNYKGAHLLVGRSFLGVKTGCWSMLGSDVYFAGIRRRMNIGTSCDDYSIVLHELGHAFGLTHEHQRSDRDDYVDIFADNIDKEFGGFGLKLNFEKQPTQNFTPYDFQSIMHYSRRAGSKNGKDTIVPKAPYADQIDVIGHARGISKEDRAALAAIYGLPPKSE